MSAREIADDVLSSSLPSKAGGAGGGGNRQRPELDPSRLRSGAARLDDERDARSIADEVLGGRGTIEVGP